MKRIIVIIMSAALILTCCVSCSKKGEPNTSSNSGKISIVCTNFAEYDFARQIAGNKASVTMLLKPGAESHSYEPTPKDIIKIEKSDIFIYVGGDSDEWVKKILKSIDKSKVRVIKLMDCVKLMEEKHVEGMKVDSDEKDSDAVEMDEHVWTSPVNVIEIVKSIKKEMCSADSANADSYQRNADRYISKLKKLDKQFRNVVDNAKRKEIIVGDRFPFAYFCKEYGLKYYAAFPGCSTDTEADASTVAFLIRKVRKDKIPVIFHIELSNGQMCSSISKATGAKPMLLNAVHNVSGSDFKKGVTYIDLMEHNVKVLREALN